MARTVVIAALLMGVVAAHAAACPKMISGYSGFFGAPLKKSTDRYVNQIPRWGAKGDITAVEMFYRDGCVTGVRPTYGADDAHLMGVEGGAGKKITLGSGETIVEVDYKGGKRCVEYVSLTTNQGRVLAIGNVASPTAVSRAAASRPGAFLGAFRGWVNAEKSLEQLQAVWGLYKCSDAPIPAPAQHDAPPADAAPVRPVNSVVPPLQPPSGGAARAPDAAAPVPVEETQLAEPEPIPMEIIEADDPSLADTGAAAAQAEAGPAPAAAAAAAANAAAAEAAAPAAAAAAPAAAEPAAAEATAATSAAVAVAKPVCAPRPDLCDAKAAAGAANSCRAVSPFETASCIGGCCVSSGRCKSGSCSANGLGKEASLTCFGQNKMAILGNRCAHLACKLAVPGCKTALIGGSCVGTVVATGNVSKLHPVGAQYIGHPCIEAVPTGGIINTPALISWSDPREFVDAAWKVCECGEPPAAQGLGLRLPKLFSAMAMPSLTNAFGLGGKNNSGGGGDASLGPSSFTAMKDLMFASMSRGDKSDPFAAFTTDDANPPQTDELAAYAAQSGDAAAVKAAAIQEMLPMDVMEASDVEAAEAAGASPVKAATLVVKADGSARVVSVERGRAVAGPAAAAAAARAGASFAKKPAAAAAGASAPVRAASTKAAAAPRKAAAPFVDAATDSTIGVYGDEGPPPPGAAAVGEPYAEEGADEDEGTYTPADASGAEVKPAHPATAVKAVAPVAPARSMAAEEEQQEEEQQAVEEAGRARKQRQQQEAAQRQQEAQRRQQEVQRRQEEAQRQQEEEVKREQQAAVVDRSNLSLDDPGPPPPEAAAVGEPYIPEDGINPEDGSA